MKNGRNPAGFSKRLEIGVKTSQKRFFHIGCFFGTPCGDTRSRSAVLGNDESFFPFPRNRFSIPFAHSTARSTGRYSTGLSFTITNPLRRNCSRHHSNRSGNICACQVTPRTLQNLDQENVPARFENTENFIEHEFLLPNMLQHGNGEHEITRTASNRHGELGSDDRGTGGQSNIAAMRDPPSPPQQPHPSPASASDLERSARREFPQDLLDRLSKNAIDETIETSGKRRIIDSRKIIDGLPVHGTPIGIGRKGIHGLGKEEQNRRSAIKPIPTSALWFFAPRPSPPSKVGSPAPTVPEFFSCPER